MKAIPIDDTPWYKKITLSQVVSITKAKAHFVQAWVYLAECGIVVCCQQVACA